jgi:Flp pilus assembly protein TadG
MTRRRLHQPRRLGAAAAELALVLPLLALLLLAAIDFARLFYHYAIVTNAARNGALYGSDPVAAAESPYSTTGGLPAAALADATDLDTSPGVSWTNMDDADGNSCVQVTVTYTFWTLISYPGIPNPVNLSRTVQMRVAPTKPSGGSM